jgi:hypothetical protein
LPGLTGGKFNVKFCGPLDQEIRPFFRFKFHDNMG